ncbi:MAG: hypothetical protein LAT82_04240 [Nanoarchaeota archaeon]|nr:hypothetical protein [Nanoarchaeota archaeon]
MVFHFLRKRKTIEEEYKEALQLAVQTFSNFPNLDMDFSDRQVNEIIRPRLNNLLVLEMKIELQENDSTEERTQRINLLSKVLDEANGDLHTKEEMQRGWEILKQLVIKRFNSLH